MEYYIRLRGQQQGPFSSDQLQRQAARNRFGRHFEVSTDGQIWQRADAYPELFPTVVVQRPKSTPVNPAPEPQPVEPEESVPAAAPEPTPVTAEQWYYTHGGEECGPVSSADINRMIGLGQVVADDHVWIEGMENWHRVRDVPELARQLSSIATAATITPAPVSAAPIPDVQSVSGFAITSFVMGLLGATIVPCLASIFAVVFGHLALSQIRQSAGRYGGSGLAITGLILGYLVIIPTVIIVIVYIAIAALAPTGTKLGGAELMPAFLA